MILNAYTVVVKNVKKRQRFWFLFRKTEAVTDGVNTVFIYFIYKLKNATYISFFVFFKTHLLLSILFIFKYNRVLTDGMSLFSATRKRCINFGKKWIRCAGLATNKGFECILRKIYHSINDKIYDHCQISNPRIRFQRESNSCVSLKNFVQRNTFFVLWFLPDVFSNSVTLYQNKKINSIYGKT